VIQSGSLVFGSLLLGLVKGLGIGVVRFGVVRFGPVQFGLLRFDLV